MSVTYGKYHDVNSTWKHNPKNPMEAFKNSLTRRNKEIAESTHICTQELLPVSWAHLSPQQTSNLYASIATCVDWSLTSSRFTKCSQQTIQPTQDHPRAGEDLPGKPLPGQRTYKGSHPNRLHGWHWIRDAAWRWVAVHPVWLPLQIFHVAQGSPQRSGHW